VRQTLVTETNEQMLIKPIYTEEDVGQEPLGDTELPGVFPYRRGPYATMYTGRPWTIR
jgi:methylmalonyl-CoA mutase